MKHDLLRTILMAIFALNSMGMAAINVADFK